MRLQFQLESNRLQLKYIVSGALCLWWVQKEDYVNGDCGVYVLYIKQANWNMPDEQELH